MLERNPDDVTLNTLHEDLTKGFAEMRSGFGDLKATLIAGFRSLPTRESSEEMVRLLREGNRLNEERFTQLDLRTREQHLETQQVLHAIVEGQRRLVESQRHLLEGQRQLVESQRQLMESQRQVLEAQRLMIDGQRSLSADIKALIARLDALIRGRDNGEPAA
jgi:superfamily II RNA helicase